MFQHFGRSLAEFNRKTINSGDRRPNHSIFSDRESGVKTRLVVGVWQCQTPTKLFRLQTYSYYRSANSSSFKLSRLRLALWKLASCKFAPVKLAPIKLASTKMAL